MPPISAQLRRLAVELEVEENSLQREKDRLQRENGLLRAKNVEAEGKLEEAREQLEDLRESQEDERDEERAQLRAMRQEVAMLRFELAESRFQLSRFEDRDDRDDDSDLCLPEVFVRASKSGLDGVLRSILEPEHSEARAAELRALLGRALLEACAGQRASTAELLLEQGADVNVRRPDEEGGRSALHFAAIGRETRLLDALLARPELKKDVLDGSGRTPLHLAARLRKVAAVRALLTAGVDATLLTPDGRTARQLGTEFGAQFSTHGGAGGAAHAAREMAATFDSPSVRFWNASTRALHAYRGSRYERAVSCFGEAIELAEASPNLTSDTNRSRLHYNRSKAALKLRRYALSLQECDAALSLDPSYRNALETRAECYLKLWDFSRAASAFGSLLKDYPHEVEQHRGWRARRDEARDAGDASHYEVLGLRDPSGATDAEVKRAYKRESMRWHPDKHRSSDEDAHRARLHFQRVNEARQVLCSPYERLMYDRERRSSASSYSGRAGDPYGIRQRTLSNKQRFKYCSSHADDVTDDDGDDDDDDDDSVGGLNVDDVRSGGARAAFQPGSDFPWHRRTITPIRKAQDAARSEQPPNSPVRAPPPPPPPRAAAAATAATAAAPATPPRRSSTFGGRGSDAGSARGGIFVNEEEEEDEEEEQEARDARVPTWWEPNEQQERWAAAATAAADASAAADAYLRRAQPPPPSSIPFHRRADDYRSEEEEDADGEELFESTNADDDIGGDEWLNARIAAHHARQEALRKERIEAERRIEALRARWRKERSYLASCDVPGPVGGDVGGGGDDDENAFADSEEEEELYEEFLEQLKHRANAGGRSFDETSGSSFSDDDDDDEDDDDGGGDEGAPPARAAPAASPVTTPRSNQEGEPKEMFKGLRGGFFNRTSPHRKHPSPTAAARAAAAPTAAAPPPAPPPPSAEPTTDAPAPHDEAHGEAHDSRDAPASPQTSPLTLPAAAADDAADVADDDDTDDATDDATEAEASAVSSEDDENSGVSKVNAESQHRQAATKPPRPVGAEGGPADNEDRAVSA